MSDSCSIKGWWSQYGGLMTAGALCCLLGLLVGVWATKDISITIKDKPCQPSCSPVEPVKPAPAPVSPAKPCPCPKKPGDIGAGPCECGPDGCHCPKGDQASAVTEPVNVSNSDSVASRAKCGCPSCCCYPCPHNVVDGRCACSGC